MDSMTLPSASGYLNSGGKNISLMNCQKKRKSQKRPCFQNTETGSSPRKIQKTELGAVNISGATASYWTGHSSANGFKLGGCTVSLPCLNVYDESSQSSYFKQVSDDKLDQLFASNMERVIDKAEMKLAIRNQQLKDRIQNNQLKKAVDEEEYSNLTERCKKGSYDPLSGAFLMLLQEESSEKIKKIDGETSRLNLHLNEGQKGRFMDIVFNIAAFEMNNSTRLDAQMRELVTKYIYKKYGWT